MHSKLLEITLILKFFIITSKLHILRKYATYPYITNIIFCIKFTLFSKLATVKILFNLSIMFIKNKTSYFNQL